MATTTRKRKKVVAKKTTKKAIRSSKKEIPSFLCLEDLRQIENLSKDVQIAKAYMSVEEQALQNMILEHRLQEINISRQKANVAVFADKYESRKKRYSEFKEIINPKYGLPDGGTIGYNPDSGEIIK